MATFEGHSTRDDSGREFPNIVWVLVHTDEGLVGLGESSFNPSPTAAYIHETAAPYLLGRDPLQIDRHWKALTGFVGYSGNGAEMRAKSALDVALWDLFGKYTGQPVYQLLGGLSQDRVRTYNTCAGYQYIRSASSPRPTGMKGRPTSATRTSRGFSS